MYRFALEDAKEIEMRVSLREADVQMVNISVSPWLVEDVEKSMLPISA